DPKELSPEIAATTDILVTNIWRADYPPAPRVRLVQSVATGIEWIEQGALPRGVPICNAYGHETAIAEYVLMVMLAWSHRFREIEGDFRLRSSWAPSWVKSGAPHGEIRGSTLGIVGLGRARTSRLASSISQIAECHHDAALLGLDFGHGAAALGRDRRKSSPLRQGRTADQRRDDDVKQSPR